MTGYLKKEYYQTYADYILKFFNAYKTNWIVNNLAPILSKAGYKDLVYIAMDDHRFMLPFHPAAMFENEEAKKLFSGIAVHWYVDRLFPASLLTKTHDMFPDKFLLMSEACTGTSATNLFEPAVILGSWNRGEQYINDIIENLNHWVCGWIDWNIALDGRGGPSWFKNYMDLPIIVNSKKDEFYKQPMFYAISHFSKFVPRGSYVISSIEENCLSKKIHSIAFSTPEQKVIVVIANTYVTTIVTILQSRSRTIKELEVIVSVLGIVKFNNILKYDTQ
ncbi:lysosomal acid glucosylceramidase-like [Nylanderia fulva]|uniref:lysosomal acid glucosylceramidase-like n=1 Tax=Nylanderia fulva TaxID=613905 RepID=UPI0010FB3E03|nr:lysosomal acid glucosylceramidase-like [Nylanderia fulva]